MTLKFITGNNGKFQEISGVLMPFKLEKMKIDLDELQDLDPKKVIEHKIKEALKHSKGGFFIEDTSVVFLGLGKRLPGTFIKWFLDELKPMGLYKLAKKLNDPRAQFTTIIAYAENSKKIHYFIGTVKGKIVKPKGLGGFGLDPIFLPNGSKKTLAELKKESPTGFSARYRAAIKLKNFLVNQ